MTIDLHGTLVIGVLCLSLMSFALCLRMGKRLNRRPRGPTNNARRRDRVPHPDVTSGFRDPYR